jgi:S1-C subfamily serine protease
MAAHSPKPTPNPANPSPSSGASSVEVSKSRTKPPPLRPPAPAQGVAGLAEAIGKPPVFPTRADRKSGNAAALLWMGFAAVLTFSIVLAVGAFAFGLMQARAPVPLVVESAQPNLSTEEVVARSETCVALIHGKIQSGTGFLAKPDLLVTNKHVISLEMPSDLEVRFPAARGAERGPFPAEILYEDDTLDLAVLRLVNHPRSLPIAVESEFRRGQEVITIGNPGMGDKILEVAVSRGVMSTQAELDGVAYHQLSMSVNPGNSGGPVFDSRGHVIGVVTLKAAQQEGIAFCIPLAPLRQRLERVSRLTPAEVERADVLHRARVAWSRISNMANEYRAAMSLYNQEMQIAIANHQSADQGVASARGKVPHNELSEKDRILMGGLSAEVSRISTAAILDESPRDSLVELWTNYEQLKSYVERPRGDVASYRAKYLELSDQLDRLSGSLKLLLGVIE